MKPYIRLLLYLAIPAAMLLTVVCYYPGLAGPFILDDIANIGLSRVSTLQWDDWVLAITGNYSGRLGRPVAATSFAVTTYFWGFNPVAFKVGNLALHLVCGVLFFLLGHQLLRNLPNAPRIHRVWIAAALAAALWLLHPLHVSTTLYAVQRMAQLSTLFVLVALCCYAAMRPRLHERPWLRLLGMSAAVGTAGLLGILSKEDAALLPVYLLLVEVIVFRWRTQTVAARRSLFLFQGLFVLAPLALATSYVATHFEGFIQGYAGRSFNLEERLLTESRALWFYLRLILVPDIAQMSLFHDGYPIQRSLDPITLAALGGHAALLASAALLIKRAPIFSLGIGFFYAAHLLESTFVPLEPVFEHRNYLAAWGVLLILACYGTHIGERAISKRVVARAAVLFGCLITLYAYTAHARAYIWGDQDRIYQHAIQNQPGSVRALTNYANSFLYTGQPGRGRALLVRALRLAGPDDIGPALQLLSTYCGSGIMPANLYTEAQRRLRHGPANAYARNTLYNLIKLQAAQRCPELTPEDLIEFTRAFLVNPSNARGKSRYHALMHYARALSLDSQHDKTIDLLWIADTMRSQVPNVAKSLALQGITLQYLRMGESQKSREALIELARLTSDLRIPAKPRIWPFLMRLKNMTFAERYGLVDFSKYQRTSKTMAEHEETAPSPDDLS